MTILKIGVTGTSISMFHAASIVTSSPSTGIVSFGQCWGLLQYLTNDSVSTSSAIVIGMAHLEPVQSVVAITSVLYLEY